MEGKVGPNWIEVEAGTWINLKRARRIMLEVNQATQGSRNEQWSVAIDGLAFNVTVDVANRVKQWLLRREVR